MNVKKQKRTKGSPLDGMTSAEAEAFVEQMLSERSDLFERTGDQWQLTPEAYLGSGEPEGEAYTLDEAVTMLLNRYPDDTLLKLIFHKARVQDTKATTQISS